MIRAASVGLNLMIIPILVTHLGREQYGVWATVNSFTTFLAAAEGGVTNAIISLVSFALGSGSRKQIRALVSSAYAITCAAAAVTLVVVVVVSRGVNWQWLLNLSTAHAGAEAGAVVLVVCGAVAVGFPAAVVRQLRCGLLQGPAVNGWDFLAVLATFCALVGVTYYDGGLIAVASAAALAPLLTRIVGSIWFYIRPGRHLRPGVQYLRAATGRELFSSGLVFMVLSLVQAFAVNSDQIVIARLIDAAAVTDYTVVQRLFDQPQILANVVLAAQWPAYSEALVRGDHDWIRTHFRRSLVASAAFGIIAAAVLGVSAPTIVRIWVGPEIRVELALIIGMSAYTLVSVVASVFLFFFLATGVHRRLIRSYAAMLAINLPLSITLVSKIGPAGAIVATAVAYSLALVGPSIFAIRGIIGDMGSLQKQALGRARGGF
jgi:O-antigen/teichoic acid export membrane protein